MADPAIMRIGLNIVRRRVLVPRDAYREAVAPLDIPRSTMSGDEKSFSWQTAIAIGGLAVSVFGNWIQYQSLQDKKTELAQAERKLDASLEEARQKREACEKRRRDFEQRSHRIDQEVEAAELEFRRGAAGMRFAPPDQKPLAAQIMQDSAALKSKLETEKKMLQEKLDALPTC